MNPAPAERGDRLALRRFRSLFLRVVPAAAIAAAPAWSAEVAVDVGHYLEKPGVTSASGIPEFELNRRLALSVAEMLADGGLGVRVIGADGLSESLAARTGEAAGTRLFVSIHHDSVRERFLPVRDPQFAGYSLWVSRGNRDYRTSARCAERVADRLLAAGFSPSRYHADPVLGEARPVIDERRGIFARDALAVLNSARSPAILVEAGVVVNPVEEAWLARPEVRLAQAKAIAAGILDCVTSQGAGGRPSTER